MRSRLREQISDQRIDLEFISIKQDAPLQQHRRAIAAYPEWGIRLGEADPEVISGETQTQKKHAAIASKLLMLF